MFWLSPACVYSTFNSNSGFPVNHKALSLTVQAGAGSQGEQPLSAAAVRLPAEMPIFLDSKETKSVPCSPPLLLFPLLSLGALETLGL